jgi:hypothetical protein
MKLTSAALIFHGICFKNTMRTFHMIDTGGRLLFVLTACCFAVPTVGSELVISIFYFQQNHVTANSPVHLR